MADINEITNIAIARGAIHKPLELRELLREVEALSPDIIVEIGSDMGGTLHGFALLVPSARLISVSMQSGPYSTMKPLEAPAGTVVFDADSHLMETWQSLVQELDNQEIDVLFIDGDHTYQGVKSDYVMYAGLVRSGGLVIFHDILPHPTMPEIGVGQLWSEIQGDKTEYLADPITWGGVGVLRKA